jgi:hypothetical protein
MLCLIFMHLWGITIRSKYKVYCYTRENLASYASSKNSDNLFSETKQCCELTYKGEQCSVYQCFGDSFFVQSGMLHMSLIV